MEDIYRKEIAALHAEIYELRKRLHTGEEPEPVPEGVVEVLECVVDDDQHVAFLLGSVSEVVLVAHMAALPEAPPWLCGILNLRGAMLPVLDVEARILWSAREHTLSDYVIIARDRERAVGLLVKDVRGVRAFRTADLQQPAEEIPYAPYVLGVFPSSPGVHLLSIRRLLSMSDLPAEVSASA
jgi:purine-binding chemotaxis protein CheW